MDYQTYLAERARQLAERPATQNDVNNVNYDMARDYIRNNSRKPMTEDERNLLNMQIKPQRSLYDLILGVL